MLLFAGLHSCLVAPCVCAIVPPSAFAQEYSRIAAANFTLLLGGFGATTRGDVLKQIEASRTAGLAVIPSSCNGACENVAGAWGTQIKDEPSSADFKLIAPAVARAKARGKIAFVNLLPNYATPAQLNASSYGDYLERYVQVVRPNLLCVDH